jgi:phosphoenolpyruvate synthase/pyruvate phosphate dikinase
MICPLITVQLWGIEACLDENYIIMKFLTRKLYEQKEDKDLKKYKDILLINEGETVAFTEKKDFYRTASSLDKPHIIELFKKDVYVIEKELENYDEENQLINNHIKKYNWINEEYVSEGWPRSKWIRLFKNALLDEKRPQEKLQELVNQFKELILKKRNVIEQLNPPENVFHSIKALSELIAQRDWTKGYVIKIFSTYRKLLKEISIRMGIDFPQILQYSYQELYDYLEKGKIISSGELIDRSKNGFAIVIKGGKFDLVTGKDKIKRLISYESVSEPFKKLSLQESFKGLPASLGKVIGRARVLDDAIKLKDFKEGEILVTYMTTIEFIPLFGKAIAIVTDEGGMSSHAAIVSREFRLPCIVGTEVATRMVKTGDLIEVDANNGVVRIIERDKTLYSED